MATGGGWEVTGLLPCGDPNCYCKPKETKVEVVPFEKRVIDLAKDLRFNRPVEGDYSWSQALADATDILLAAEYIALEADTLD